MLVNPSYEWFKNNFATFKEHRGVLSEPNLYLWDSIQTTHQSETGILLIIDKLQDKLMIDVYSDFEIAKRFFKYLLNDIPFQITPAYGE
jgi:hypothetical protein